MLTPIIYLFRLSLSIYIMFLIVFNFKITANIIYFVGRSFHKKQDLCFVFPDLCGDEDMERKHLFFAR